MGIKRFAKRPGQSTVENLLVICVVVGIVLIIGVKLKKYIPDIFGPIGNVVTGSVAAIPDSEFKGGYTRNDFRGYESTSSGATTLRTTTAGGWESGGSASKGTGSKPCSVPGGGIGQCAPTVGSLK